MATEKTPRRKYEFTCQSASRVHRRGHFVKGQKVIVFDDDPRLTWLRSGGFAEKDLGFESLRADKPKTKIPDDPMKMKIADIDGIPGGAKIALETAGIKTVEDFSGKSDEELLAIKGIGEPSLKKSRDAIYVLLTAK